MPDNENASNESAESNETAEIANSAGSNEGGEPRSNNLSDLLSGLDEASRKVVLGQVSKARDEAAKYRSELREKEPLVAEAEKLREASKSDIEKLTERASQFEKSALDKDLRIAQLTAVITHGLELEDVDMLGGTSAEDIAAKAERFATRLNAGKSLNNKPRENLKSGGERNEEPDTTENDPEKLAALVLARQYG